MIEILISIGLSEKEAQIYLELLKLGTQPASIIAKRLNIPKSTANFNLEELAKKNFANKTKKANTFLYTAEDPSVIVNVLEHQKSQQISIFNHKIENVKSAVMELKSLQKGNSNKPNITFYEGEEGIKKVYEDTLTSSETIRSFASFDSMHGTLPEYFATYYQRRVAKGIFIRSIHPDTELAREHMKLNEKEWRKGLLVPAYQYNFSPEIQLYDKKINITSWKEKLGIIIESKEIYDTLVVAFELAWKEAERLNKKL